jgi:hypothetical protein
MCVCAMQMLLPLLRELRGLRSAMSDGAAVEPAHLLRLQALLQQVGGGGTSMGTWGTTSGCRCRQRRVCAGLPANTTGLATS